MPRIDRMIPDMPMPIPARATKISSALQAAVSKGSSVSPMRNRILRTTGINKTATIRKRVVKDRYMLTPFNVQTRSRIITLSKALQKRIGFGYIREYGNPH